MNKIVKIACLIIAVTMVFGIFAACKPTETKQVDEATAAPQEEVKESTEPEATEEEAQEPTEITFFIKTGPEFPVEDNPIGKVLGEATNTILKFEVPPAASYFERMQILFATDELPEIIQMDSTSNEIFINGVADGSILPITEQVNNSANLLEYCNPASWISLTVDGEIVGIPRNTLNRADGFAVRKDWLDAVGLSVPEDGVILLDDFTEILRRFTFNDPDGNGKDDTYGLTLGVNEGTDYALEVLAPFKAAYGVRGWQEYSDEPYTYMNKEYSVNDDSYKNAINYVASLWSEGLLDPNWPNNKEEMTETRFFQGVAGMWYAYSGNTLGDHDLKVKENFPDAELTYITRLKLTEDSDIKGVGFGSGMWWFNCITKSASGKEDAVVGLFDYMISDEGYAILRDGLEGVHKTTAADGTVTLLPAYETDYLPWKGGLLLVRQYLDMKTFLPRKETDTDETYAKKSTWLSICAGEMVMSMDYGYNPAVTQEAEYIDYKKTLQQGISKIIVGSLPISEWDSIIAGWYEAGGTEYIEEMNEYIASLQ